MDEQRRPGYTLSQPFSNRLKETRGLMASSLEHQPATDEQWRALVSRSAHGVLVVDSSTVVRFANAAAEQLLSVGANQLIGQEFGLPLVTDQRTEIDSHRPDKSLLTLEMRVADVTWEGGPALVVSLHDISGQVQAQAGARRSEQFARAILDSLSAAVAVVDADGQIRATNAAWTAAANRHRGNSLLALEVGQNYFAACRAAAGAEAATAGQALAGMQAVLHGRAPSYELEYTVPGTAPEVWFILRVTPLHDSPDHRLVIWQTDVSANKLAALAAQETRLETDRQTQRDQERSSLERLSTANPTPVTAQSFGLAPLRSELPAVFAEILQRYLVLFDQSLERRAFRVEPPISDEMRNLAQYLGQHRAVPRDVLELHLAALKTKTSAASPGRVQAYTEEGRILALELMGYLAAYYRQYVTTSSWPGPERRPPDASPATPERAA